mgnify:CR=1 FL=1
MDVLAKATGTKLQEQVLHSVAARRVTHRDVSYTYLRRFAE